MKSALFFHRFYVISAQALGEWSENVKQTLATRAVGSASALMKYASDRPTVAVGSLSELLEQLPEIAAQLDFTVVVTAVAQVESFLEEVLFELFVACPQFLSFGVQKPRPMHGDAARARATALLLKPFEEVVSFLVNHVGIDLKNAPEGVDEKAVLEVVVTRNLLLHNNGIVDKKYLGRVLDSELKIGEERRITPRYIQDSLNAIENFIVYIDNQVAEVIARNGGTCIEEYADFHYGHRPRRGEPTTLVRCWCVEDPPAEHFSELGICASYLSRRGEFPDGRILSYCVFAEDRFRLVEKDPRFLFLPVLSTPASELSEDTRRRITQLKVAISPSDTVYEILQKICACCGSRFPTLVDEPDHI